MNQYELNELGRIASLVQEEARNSRESIIKSEYDTRDPENKLNGLCYVVSEAMYHLTGGKNVWKPSQMEHEGVSHWFLIHKETGTVFDLTESQFETPVSHDKARGRGFCTGEPSRRASLLIERVENRIQSANGSLRV